MAPQRRRLGPKCDQNGAHGLQNGTKMWSLGPEMPPKSHQGGALGRHSSKMIEKGPSEGYNFGPKWSQNAPKNGIKKTSKKQHQNNACLSRFGEPKW